MKNIIWALVALLIIGWLLGFIVFKIMGGLVHLLLILAIILLIFNWFKGRSKTPK
ncbi:lmo0937 family membrane protein [Arenibacter sp. M-2]|uniref:lmo0937 family membrane protein n=1 Tax=Arenibacter TaxID=178469 RepID=UPI0025700737|nr:lmo0937 family membrane protein [Arenibacter sp. M-2]MDL5514351.1 lmo0937 family membrane protein [Arenibacter sp. M-2]